MKENLRIILLIIGVVAIIALFLHGVWSSRKEKSTLFGKKKKSNRRIENDNPRIADDIDVFDNDTQIIPNSAEVSEVRVKNEQSSKESPISDPSSVTHPKDDISLNTDNAEYREAMSQVSSDDSQTTQTEPSFSPNPDAENLDAPTEQKENQPQIQEEEPIEEHVIVLHVMGVNNSLLRGDLLLNSFLNAGLNFGDMNIFHRHLSTAASPVIFSVANMVKPGTFEPNQMLEFTTIGITFFMVLPSAGEPIQNFKLMLQTVQRIAEDVGGQVYDDKRTILTQLKTEAISQSINDWMIRTGQNA